ncbi:MAG: hypothetical protein PVI21_03725 [Candidatus Woesebacteria bacterium]
MRKDNESFLTFTRNRPTRIAFVVDIKEENAYRTIVDLICDASKKWGGRYYQIIPAAKGTVSKVWIEYLAAYDPDLIYTYYSLAPKTVQQISEVSSPLAFMNAQFKGVPNHPFDPVDIFPDNRNTAMLWRNPVQTPEILSFDLGGFSPTAPQYITDFVMLNFGTIQNDLANINAIKQSQVILTKPPAQTEEQFLEAMKKLDEWNRRIYPIEYSMIPGLTYESDRDLTKETTTVYIGDEPLDLIYYWNDALLRPDWLTHQKNQAILPTKFIEDEKLRLAVRGWLTKFIRQENGNSSLQRVEIVSASVSLTKLQAYAKQLLDGTYIFHQESKVTVPIIPKYSTHIATTPDMTSFSVSGDSFTVNVPSIDVVQGVMGGQKWMTDVLIERKDHNEHRQPLKDFWLQLPLNNSLTLLLTNRTRAARINRLGFLSVPLSRDVDDLRLTVNIPDGARIAESILRADKNSIFYNGDLRQGKEDYPFSGAKSSTAGKALRGAIHLFRELPEAANFFQSDYWRDIFMIMAGQDPLGSPKTKQALENAIKKNFSKVKQTIENDVRKGLATTKQPVSQKVVDFWSNKIGYLASDLRARTDVQEIGFFDDVLKNKVAEANKNGDKERFAELRERMLGTLDWLIANGIFSIGTLNHCRRCGLKEWHSVDDLKTDNACRGCGNSFTVAPEQQWWYKLNSLISSEGGIYNQVPLILALGELYEGSTSSFMYFPPVDVYTGKGYRLLTDLDIFAIVDGKLVVGEVKNSAALFDDEEIDKLLKAAARLKPCRVVLFAPDKPNQALLDKVRLLNQQYSAKGITVEWLNMTHLWGMGSLWNI